MNQRQSPPPFLEPIHILGAGSMGLLLAANIRMAYPSFPLTLLLRPLDLRKELVVNISQDKRQRIVRIPARSVDSISSPLDNILLTTKAGDARTAVDSVRHLLYSAEGDTQSEITFLGNGALAVEHELTGAGYSEVKLGIITHGAYLDRSSSDESSSLPNLVHAGLGRLYLDQNPSLADLLDRAGLNCHHVSTHELRNMLWLKLAANCVINPLTSLHGLPNGSIRQLDGFESSLEDIVTEIVQVHGASQVDVPSLDLTTVTEFVRQVIEETASNKSSMLQDITASRATEISYLNGYVANLGETLGIPCPANQDLVRRIRQVEDATSSAIK